MKNLNASTLFKLLSATIAFVCMAAAFSVTGASSVAHAALPDSGKAHLERFGITGRVEASTYGHNRNGFMAKVDGKTYIADLKNNQVASIENPNSVFEKLPLQRDKESVLFIVQFLIHNDSYGSHHHYGEWRGSHHLFPMYILAEYDENGNVIPADSRVFSGEGASPSHYHGNVQEQKYIDLALLFAGEVFPYADCADMENTVQNKWPGSYPGMITGDEVNIRTGAGTGYRSLGVFFKGDNVTLLNRVENGEGVWYEVKFYNSQYGWIQGWVSGNYIEER